MGDKTAFRGGDMPPFNPLKTHFLLSYLAHMLTIKARKAAISPSLTVINRSKTMERHEKPSKSSGYEKTPETLIFRGFLHVRWSRSALAELRRAAGGLEAGLYKSVYNMAACTSHPDHFHIDDHSFRC